MIKEIRSSQMVLYAGNDLVASQVKEYVSSVTELTQSEAAFETVVLDLQKVNIIDSIGISFVVSLYRSVTQSGKTFKVINVKEDIHKLFQLMRLDELF